MQLELDRPRLERQLGETARHVRARRPGGRQREQPRVLEQEQIVLADVPPETLGIERTGGQPLHERVLELGAPERLGLAPQRIGETLIHTGQPKHDPSAADPESGRVQKTGADG